jgi:hypothetical protein
MAALDPATGTATGGLAGRNGQVFLVSAARTPIGKFGGAFVDTPATTLGGVAIRAAVERSGLPEGTLVDEVLMGQVLQGGAGQAPARQAALAAGLADSTSATTINRVCGSGLKSIMLAAAEIRAGDAEIVVAGGMENMNMAPFLLPKARFGYRLGDGRLIDSAVADGLTCAFEGCHMGTHAERVAIHDHVSREDQDAFALASHQRAIAAQDGGRFAAELASVTVRDAIPRSRRWPDSSPSSTCRPATIAATRRSEPSPPATPPGSPTGPPRRSSSASAPWSSSASSPSPGSSATPRPRSRPSGCSSRRSPASAACSTGSSCRSRRSI